MSLVYLSLGSNIQPEKNIPTAIEKLKTAFNVTRISSCYETDPVGPAGPHKFCNMAVSIETDLSREILTKKIRTIESELGRVRSSNRFAPRTIDIDILPQTDYQKMAFIMIPLAEIAPGEIDAESGKSFAELADLLRAQAENFRKI